MSHNCRTTTSLPRFNWPAALQRRVGATQGDPVRPGKLWHTAAAAVVIVVIVLIVVVMGKLGSKFVRKWSFICVTYLLLYSWVHQCCAVTCQSCDTVLWQWTGETDSQSADSPALTCWTRCVILPVSELSLCQSAVTRFIAELPRAGSGVVRIDMHRFLAGCRTRRLNQAVSVLYLSMFYCVVVY